MKTFLLAVVLLWPFAAAAQGGWRDMEGNPIPETAAAKSADGFHATLIVTPDQDWQEKWNTPPETVPHFSEASEVGPGGEPYILAFLSNPKRDPSGMTDVTCDFTVVRPDGTKSVDEADMDCFTTQLATDPTSVYLSAISLKYVAEPADPRGKWTVRVTMRDNHRGVEIPLEATFLVR